MENKKVIQVKDLTKMYKLYDKPSDRLKEALGLTRKKLYKEHYALKDVSFDIGEGECVGIIGTNGSGKSTILKIITGVLAPTAGTVTVNGRISALLELGAGFNPEYSGMENIFLNGSVLGYSKQMMEEKFDEILEFSELQPFVDVAVKNYSSGMVARLAFAIATITKPDILIVDEILAVGDFLFQQKCEKRIREMMDRGTTVIIVSHTIEQIERLCKHVLWLEHGNMKMLGDTKTVCDAYKAI